MTITKFPNELNNTETNSMSDFERMLGESLEKTKDRVSVGDKVRAEILSVGKDNLIVSTGTQFDGFAPTAQFLDLEGRCTVKVGDFVDLTVSYVRGSEIHLSNRSGKLKLAEGIQEAFDNGLPLEGRVAGVNKGGFEVVFFGQKAFCPFSHMDLKKIEKPEEFIGKKLQFHVSQLDEGGRNFVVSRRKVLEHDQEVALSDAKGQRQVGEILNGKVTRIENFGAFVEIAPGVEGMVHVSEMSWTRVNNPADFLKIGQEISVKVLKVEQGDRRLKISLSVKQVEGSPWESLPAHIQVGQVVAGKVTRCMPFGAFVELVPGVEGLIPLSQLSSTKRVSSAEEVVKVGQEVAVMIKEINQDARRLSLSLKDAAEQELSMSEAQDIKDFQTKQKNQEIHSGQSDLALKLQAALSKKS